VTFCFLIGLWVFISACVLLPGFQIRLFSTPVLIILCNFVPNKFLILLQILCRVRLMGFMFTHFCLISFPFTSCIHVRRRWGRRGKVLRFCAKMLKIEKDISLCKNREKGHQSMIDGKNGGWWPMSIKSLSHDKLSPLSSFPSDLRRRQSTEAFPF